MKIVTQRQLNLDEKRFAIEKEEREQSLIE